ncbi:GL10413 [Drosophila persimilis]|uniref:GL10413 n=3 Tax=Drosophila TaxID=7215 RepID=B4GCT2_DROPE|nr:GL10413 [Drosophila persimilis]
MSQEEQNAKEKTIMDLQQALKIAQAKVKQAQTQQQQQQDAGPAGFLKSFF